MWSSIKTIHHPDSLVSASQLAKEEATALLAGGTYLVAERYPAISNLVDLNGLLKSEIKIAEQELICDAGVVLQDLVDHFSIDDPLRLGTAARHSCSSKNIRNQRTLGGEIARGRTDSELVVALTALNAQLITAEDSIITGVAVDLSDNPKVALERFALLPSAPAFVIVAAVCRGESLKIVVGGKADKLAVEDVPSDGCTVEWIAGFCKAAAERFPADHIGNRDYKQTVITTGLKRVAEALCR